MNVPRKLIYKRKKLKCTYNLCIMATTNKDILLTPFVNNCSPYETTFANQILKLLSTLVVIRVKKLFGTSS